MELSSHIDFSLHRNVLSNSLLSFLPRPSTGLGTLETLPSTDAPAKLPSAWNPTVGKALFRHGWKTRQPHSVLSMEDPQDYRALRFQDHSAAAADNLLGNRRESRRGSTQCHSYVTVGKARCITIFFSLKKPEFDSLSWIFSCLLWGSSPFLTLSHRQT